MRKISYAPDTIVKLPNIFGDGSDGNVTISSNTTLTRDMNYSNLTVDTGIVLTTGGYRIFVQNTLTNNGTIRNNAPAGSAEQGGLAATANTVPTGGVGGAGSTAVNNGLAPTDMTTALGIADVAAGAGGNAGAQTGGAGGTWTNGVVGAGALQNIVTAMSLQIVSVNTIDRIAGNPGGGGGANASGAGTVSGGGGAGGGFVFISCKAINNTNGTIQALGGAGAAATGGGNAGGGGGGAGGNIILIYLTIARGTESVSGGAGGAKVGTGVAGAAGAAGNVVLVAGV